MNLKKVLRKSFKFDRILTDWLFYGIITHEKMCYIKKAEYPTLVGTKKAEYPTLVGTKKAEYPTLVGTKKVEQTKWFALFGKEKFMRLKLYRVDPDYCDFLRQTDSLIPDIQGKKSQRPFAGILFSIEGYQYYAPLTSPKEKHKRL